MLKRIGAEESGEFKAVASGTLPSGKPVVINSNGTVSVVSEASTSESVGTPVNITGSQLTGPAVAYDANAQKVVIAYRDNGNSNQGYAIVGTVSGTSINFGTPAQFDSAYSNLVDITYNSTAQKVVISYKNVNNGYGYGVVGTVSGTSISFGSPVIFKTAALQNLTRIAYHSAKNRVGIIYKNASTSDNGEIVIGEVSGTSLTFGSSVTFESGLFNDGDIVYDASAERFVTAHKDENTSNNGFCCVISVGGTGDLVPTVNTRQAFNGSSAALRISAAYDSSNQKVVISFADGADGNKGTAIVATIGSTSATFGTKVQFTSSNISDGVTATTYDSGAGKVVISYRDRGNSDSGTVVSGTVSGTSISFDTPVAFDTNTIGQIHNAYDANAGKVVTVYYDDTTSEGQAVIFQTGYTSTTLTSENYIGMSRGVAFKGGAVGVVGTAVVFESASIGDTDIGYDSSNNKVVVCYKDNGNSDSGTAVVGTVDNSDNSITFGTPVVFNSGRTDNPKITFDSSNNKVVIIYSDFSTTLRGTAIVGTVSGTSISFGSEVQYETGRTDWNAVTFDSANNKVVAIYQDLDDSSKGKAAVGTVSGTSISFGTPVVFEADDAQYMVATFDSTNDKVVIAYRNNTDTAGNAIVGTVSGTSISFGTAAVYSTDNVRDQGIAFDPNEGKVVVTFRDEGASNKGTAVVGTVSGTGISFGSKVVYFSTRADQNDINYNSVDKKFTITFIDDSGTPVKAIGVKISGTSLDVDDDILTVDSDASAKAVSVYDANANRIVVAWQDTGNSSYGTGAVVKSNTIATTRAEVASGQAASMDIIGSVSDNQIGLTAGQQYFVRTDGTINTTAGSPSVLAGTAISATELVVKT